MFSLCGANKDFSLNDVKPSLDFISGSVENHQGRGQSGPPEIEPVLAWTIQTAGNVSMSDPLQEASSRRIHQILNTESSYIQDGLASIHSSRFMTDPAFADAYARGVRAAGKDYMWHWRVHLGLWAASVAGRLPGEFVECGVNAGFMSSSIMQYLDWNRMEKTFYLLDTFSGIDEKYVSEAERAEGILEKNRDLLEEGFYVTDPAAVEKNFTQWKRVKIIQGSIPEILPLVPAETIAFLHVDLNCAPPEATCVEFFWNRLTPGALVLLDDYAYFGYHHQKAAMDELASKLGVSIASIPTGQGLMIKP